MELTSLVAAGIKTQQNGFVDTATPTNGAAGEDRVYVDITIAAVDIAKSVVDVSGGYSMSLRGSSVLASNPSVKAVTWDGVTGGGASVNYSLMGRLINSTTLRLSVYNPVTTDVTNPRFMARWSVVEGK